MKIIFYDKLQAIHFLKNSKDFLEYFQDIRENTFKEKAKFNIKNIDNYLSHVVNFTNKEKNIIIEDITNIPSNLLIKLPWIFIKVSDSLEKGWPFTIANTIIVTNKLLTHSSNHDLKLTLSHEKIHNLQWEFPQLFYNMYISLGFYPIKINNLDNIPIYSNPDGLQTKKLCWIFRKSNKYYLPLLLYKNSQIEKIAYRVKLINESEAYITSESHKDLTKLLKNKFPECEISQCYHPHEIFADLGSHYIMDATTQNPQIDDFFKKLEQFIADYKYKDL